ncbi:MAG: crotonase/enoyl-CoA hydratase family protein [Rhodospirillaceae bacterium]|nr:crotonase/enoyl-CoA hydratase family protein [Rhodospirillaceae bacterium]
MNEMVSIQGKSEGMGRIATERGEHLFLITIDRAEKYNGFTPKMCLELAEAYHEYEADPTLRCAVLSAEGDNFTAGLQLGEFDITEPDFFPRELVDPLNLREPFRKKPVIAAVKGICFTIGIELMLAADIVIAEADTRFGQIEVKRGLMAFGGATMRFVERAGWGNAMSLLLTGDEFDATTASRMGFVQEIVDKGQGRVRAMELARTIARQAPLAVQATRANAAIYEREGPAAAVAAFDCQLKEIAATEDFAEGVQSFIERRDAVFIGR